jgi:hypothetical protein
MHVTFDLRQHMDYWGCLLIMSCAAGSDQPAAAAASDALMILQGILVCNHDRCHIITIITSAIFLLTRAVFSLMLLCYAIA